MAAARGLAAALWVGSVLSTAPVLGTPTPDGLVRLLIETTDQACFQRGGDAERLEAWARERAWMPAPSRELERHANKYTTLVGGWTLETEFGAFAVIQSEIKPPGSGHVCSLTTKLVSVDQHSAAKAAFAERYGAAIAEETDRPDQHTDRYWIERGRQPPVQATIVHTPASRVITIRMIHGQAIPLRS